MVNRIKLLEELKKYAVFSVRIVSLIIDKKKTYSKLVIHRLKKSGLVFRLEKDKYTVYSDPVLVASRMVWPSYISSWAAIRYYNLTDQLPTHIQVVTTRSRKRRRVVFNNASIEFIKIKKQNFFGFEKVAYGEFEIFMAEKEKALADALYLKQMSFETFLEILQQYRKEMNVKKLMAYLKKMGLKNAACKLRGE